MEKRLEELNNSGISSAGKTKHHFDLKGPVKQKPFSSKSAVLTINCKSSVKEVLCSPNHSTNHRQSSAAVFILLVGFTQQLRLQIPIIFTPSAVRKTDPI